MIKELIFGIIGGLGLFIFGINIMSSGLQHAAGEKMHNIIKYLTNNRFKGLSLGAGVTAIIQSSSATTVMVVGFVNAGLMTLTQAIPVILGANIGTTITAQLIAFKLTDYALPIIAVGSFMYLFSKKKINKQIGEAILGFGILFLGLNIMGSSVKVLGSGSVIHNVFSTFSSNPILGVLVGLIATAIVQSSSVTTGIIVLLASMGLIDFAGALPLLFGTNIGTCVTALIASIKTNITARRAAIAHVLFNVIGSVIGLLMIPLYIKYITMIPGSVERQVANAHTFFNIFSSLLFIGFVGPYAKLIKKIIPGEDIIIQSGPKYLSKSLLHTPSLALEATRKEIIRTMEIAKNMTNSAIRAFYTENNKEIDKIREKEKIVDELRDEITNYISLIVEKEINQKDAKMIPSYLHSINDIERIGDHAENITYLAERKINNGLKFTKTGENEINKMHELVKEMMHYVITALPNQDRKIAKKINQKENELNILYIKTRENHVNRLNKKQCNAMSGIAFVDMLSNLEKIGDHLANIGQAIEGKMG